MIASHANSRHFLSLVVKLLSGSGKFQVALCTAFCLWLYGCAAALPRAYPNSTLSDSTYPNANSEQQSRALTAAPDELRKANVEIDASSGVKPIDPVEPVAGYTIEAVNLPLQVLLYSLAEKAGLELKLDAPLPQAVTLRVTDKTIEHILGLLVHQSDIRWELNEATLAIASKEPFLQSYSVDYLNMSRTANSRVGLATQVGSINLAADAGNSSSGFSNSSQSVIENQSVHHFWESLNNGLAMILAVAPGQTGNLLINRDAGAVTVRGSAQQHRDVRDYLDKIQEIAQRQVLIEATVVEVALSDQYQAGIDWRILGGSDSGFNAAQVLHGQALPDAANINKLPAPAALLSVIHQSNTLGRITATLQLLKGFGDVRILSRPQIIAINNQSAILKVVDNRVYFTMSVERQSREGQDDITTSTQIHTVPVGLVMNVTPYIGADKTVILNVRPTISRILGFVNDPNPELAAAQVQNGVPEIQVREMESVLKVPDGEVVMIGGLMQQQRNSQTQSVPFLAKLPLVGSLFRNKTRRGSKTELLVFLQPTVLEDPDG